MTDQLAMKVGCSSTTMVPAVDPGVCVAGVLASLDATRFTKKPTTEGAFKDACMCHAGQQSPAHQRGGRTGHKLVRTRHERAVGSRKVLRPD